MSSWEVAGQILTALCGAQGTVILAIATKVIRLKKKFGIKKVGKKLWENKDKIINLIDPSEEGKKEAS